MGDFGSTPAVYSARPRITLDGAARPVLAADEAQRKGVRAAADIARAYSHEAMGRKMVARLKMACP